MVKVQKRLLKQQNQRVDKLLEKEKKKQNLKKNQLRRAWHFIGKNFSRWGGPFQTIVGRGA